MSDSKLNSVHLSERDIQGYLDSNLSDKEMHRIERHLLSCDFCAEAMEGYETVPAINAKYEIDELNNKILQRSEKKEKRSKFQILRIAAIAIALIISAVFVTNYLIKDTQPAKLTENKKIEEPSPKKQQNSTKENNSDSIQSSKSLENSEKTITQSDEKIPVDKPVLVKESVQNLVISDQNEVDDAREDLMIADTEEEMEEIAVIEFSIALDRSEKMSLSAPMQSMGKSAAKEESYGYSADENIQADEAIATESLTLISSNEINAISGVAAGAEIKDDKAINNLNAQPFIGFDAYKLYLKENVQFPNEAIENDIKGKVIIQFDLDSLGNMSHFKIEKGLGFGCDEEAIRLIKEGPAWNPAIKEGQSINQELKIKIHFK